MSRRIEIELHDPYIEVLSEWASVGRTLREAQRLIDAFAYEMRSANMAGTESELEKASHCSEELDEIIPALDHLHHTARQELWTNGQPKYIQNGLDTRVALYLEGSWRAPAVAILPTTRVFLLLNGKFVVCEKCALTVDLAEANAVGYFAINVVPYSQKCHQCREDIVRGWITQLFDNPRDAR